MKNWIGKPYAKATPGDLGAYCILHWREGYCHPQLWWLRQIRKLRRIHRARITPRSR